MKMSEILEKLGKDVPEGYNEEEWGMAVGFLSFVLMQE